MSEPPETNTGFESFLAEISTRFTGLPGDRVDAEIDRALRELVEFLGTDRATLLEFDGDDASLRPTHSWARPPAEPYRGEVLQTESAWDDQQVRREATLRLARVR